MDLEGGIELALRSLASVNDDGLDATGVDIAVIDTETKQFSKLEEDDIADRLDEFDLGGDE